jgi:hypothetical protein
LIASCDAIGPPGICCESTVTAFPSASSAVTDESTVCAVVKPRRFWMTPWDTSTKASTVAIGNRMRSVERVMSTQKLPIVAEPLRTRPRINATATAIPTAADTKFCTVSPAICTRCDMVDSPE